uniref:Sphingomyelin phosphodiesterase 2 n=1 Tax=Nothoprocta perdicaria TaxID=30464 RepID=A0A8C6Z0Z7_NOTPE
MADDPVLQLRVFNLNCWGIRYLSKRRQERVRLLGDTLRREPFDLVLLQEVWSEQDYALLQEKLGKCCPFSHYFRSGVIGSGLCVFSKFPILDTFLHQYSLNGYPYMLWHGDWFCGKSVGLVVLQIDGIVFNVYVTHLHAEYCRDKDTYLPHRLVQTWELAQFIRHTSQAADVVLLGGDLNTQPQDLGMRLLRGCTGLRDAFAEAERFEGCKDGCTLVPSNCFTVKTELRPFPLGIRIDYILYKAVSNVAVTCKELWTTTGTAPGRDIPYSDHEAVMATLCVRRQQRPRGAETGSEVPGEPPGQPLLSRGAGCQARPVHGATWGQPARGHWGHRHLFLPPSLSLHEPTSASRRLLLGLASFWAPSCNTEQGDDSGPGSQPGPTVVRQDGIGWDGMGWHGTGWDAPHLGTLQRQVAALLQLTEEEDGTLGAAGWH